VALRATSYQIGLPGTAFLIGIDISSEEKNIAGFDGEEGVK